MVKRFLTVLAVGVLLVSCSDDKKVRAKRFHSITNRVSDDVSLISVDTMYHTGDTLYIHRIKYVIIK
jgi:PBP1b-binding outer membrane lipoprotein LpoB